MARPKTTPAKALVIDAGNGNTKVSIANETEIIPSVLSQNDGNYIRGGFTLAGEQWILGWDNFGRTTVKQVINEDQGKLKLLPQLLAGSISCMKHLINVGDKLQVHVLTLNSNKSNEIAEAVKASVKDLVIDGVEQKLTAELAGVYPEGYGASLYAGQHYKNHRRVAVLDMGNGTLNLSQYFRGQNGLPRRESFTFVPFGVQKYISFVSEILTYDTSNGDVDETLVRQALDSNTYSYLSSYEGTPIWEQALKAAEHWSEQPKVKQMLVQCLRLVSADVPVVLVGGGFSLHAVEQTVVKILTSKGKEQLVHKADEPLTIGVSGLLQSL